MNKSVNKSVNNNRIIDHDEAMKAAMALIDHYFQNGKSRVKVRIPAQPDDDTDLILCTYINQQKALNLPTVPTAPNETPEQQQLRVAAKLSEDILALEQRGNDHQATGLAVFMWLVRTRVELENALRMYDGRGTQGA